MPAQEDGDELVNSMTILHFNDCYNVEPREAEPAGGAARFCTALKSFSHLDPLILFSGDVIAPSISKVLIFFSTVEFYLILNLFLMSVSTFTKGEQMIPVLNSCGVHCAIYGNHEFGMNEMALKKIY